MQIADSNFKLPPESGEARKMVPIKDIQKHFHKKDAQWKLLDLNSKIYYKSMFDTVALNLGSLDFWSKIVEEYFNFWPLIFLK